MNSPNQITQPIRGEIVAEQSVVIGEKTVLEGTWSAIDATVSGDYYPDVVGQSLRFSGNRFQITKNGELLFGGTYNLDAATEPPTIVFDQNETERLAGVWHGIYEFVGDELRICDNAPDMTTPRPTGFDQRSAEGYIWVRFTRQDG